MQARGSLRCHFHYHNRIVKEHTRGPSRPSTSLSDRQGPHFTGRFHGPQGSTTPVHLPGISPLSTPRLSCAPTSETPNLANSHSRVNDLQGPKLKYFKNFSGGSTSPQIYGSSPEVSQFYRPISPRQAIPKNIFSGLLSCVRFGLISTKMRQKLVCRPRRFRLRARDFRSRITARPTRPAWNVPPGRWDLRRELFDFGGTLVYS
jgi:hypothetical protein